MGRLNDFLVKEADTPGFWESLGGILAGPGPSPEVQKRRAAEEADREAAFKRIENALITGTGFESWMEPYLQAYGFANAEALTRPEVLEALNSGDSVLSARWAGKRAGHAGMNYHRRDGWKYRSPRAESMFRNVADARLNEPANTPGDSVGDTPAAPAPEATPAPTQPTTPEVAPTAEASLTLGGPDFGITTPQTDLGAGETTSPLAQPAPTPQQPAAPQGLTRDETKILLSQGYMPTSAGGYMNNADGAAQMLAKMDKDENYNPGAVITDARRLDKIRNEMLHNFEYTTAGHQLQADAALLQEAADYERMRANRDSQHQSGVDAHKARLTEEAERNLLHQGQNEYMRWVNAGSTGPMSEAANYYYQKENAVKGVNVPLPASVQSGIDSQVQRYSQQNTPTYGNRGQVTSKNPNSMTQEEVMRSTQGNRANTVLQWARELSPERRAAAEKVIRNRPPVAPAASNHNALAGGKRTTSTISKNNSSMNKLASQMLEKAQEFIEENPGLITGLAATGGLGALGGAALTNVDEDDSAGEKFKKRLKNALLTGGLAAGAYGAVNYGANKIQNALPEDDVSPISAAVHSSPVRLLGIGTGAGIGAAIQGKDSKNAISEVFGNKHVSKNMLVDILNNPADHSSAITKIKGVWHDPTALKDWVERTGIDTSKLADPEFSNMAAYTNEATDLLNKNKAMKDIADKINITPDKLAKWRLAAKRNKYLLGAAGAGLLLPEGLSTVGDLVGRLFGSSLHE